ncbi:MAG: penicillin-binding protein, partial [Nitrospirae bacterium CG_4_9_14_0_8_um_filter_70_14]
AVEGFSVAGKTGTAQQYDPQLHHYSHTRFVSSFVGIVPAEQPRLVCIVSLDGARGKAYGGQVAAPIFKEIATRTLRYLGVQPGNPPRILQVAEAQPAPRLAALAP